MRIELELQKFRDMIILVSRAAGKHVSLPVLSCVLLESNKKSTVLKATNLEIGVEVEIPAKVDGEGIVAVPAQTLSSFISQSSGGGQIVQLENKSGNLEVKLPKSEAVIKTIPADDFPAIPQVADAKEFKIDTNLLIKGFKSVWYSASLSSVKPELASIYVYHDNDHLVFVTTDSFRLAEKKIKTPSRIDLDGGVLIPFKNSVDIISILENMGDTVTVKISKNLISFNGAGINLVSRVVDGTFPDYKQIIPKGFVTEAVVLKEDLQKSLKISNIFSDKFNQTKIIINPKKKSFEIQSKNSDVGENKTAVDAALSGEPIEATFNYKYISDCFQSIDADSVSLQFNGSARPLVIRPVSGDQTFMYLVMPMNR
jgi:DNA polymerase-3 subunit beta